ncbi:glycosyltransferase family 2 protein [Rhodoferax sp.]|uniref:glycosyltransferase family 2 protein n=1 Tax=Rhodoferax sp. TaxID=50421 RepID=UPI002773359E|nr:glycosyltransferase family 2 protein [Rhodoferax sp.]
MTPRPSSNPAISCVMPAFNEARNLGVVVPEVLAALAALSQTVELIVVDDGSSDNTREVARQLASQHPELVYVRLSRNFGKEHALTAGIDAARGDIVILMDADGQHPTALLADMLDKWRDGADVVYAVRQSRADQSNLQIRLTAWFYKLVNWGNRVKIPPDAGDFRLMDRKVVQALKSLPERNRFMKGLYAWVGFNSTAINYQPLPRADGATHFGLRGSMSLALTGMVAFSTAPLRMLTVLGLVLASAALAYGAWEVLDYLVWGVEVPGYATLVTSIMFFSGVQLLSIGILAEYVGRIYDEVKQRPAYLIMEHVGKGLAGPAPNPNALEPSPIHQEASLL